MKWTCLIALLPIVVNAQPGRINEFNGRHLVDVLLETGAGAALFQDYINDNTKYETVYLRYYKELDAVWNDIYHKLGGRTNALKEIVEYVYDNRYEFQSDYNLTRCCDVSLSENHYDTLYQTRVDSDNMCYMVAPNLDKGDVESSVHLKPNPRLINTLYVNYKAINLGGLRHQYLAFEDGLFIRYPALTQCDNVDPRTLSWYKSGANKQDKAITILFDASEETDAPYGDTTLLELTKEVIRKIVSSTSNTDTLAIIPMTDDLKYQNSTKIFSDCFTKHFMYVSDKLKSDVDTFLDLLIASGTGWASGYINDTFQSYVNYPYDQEVRPKEPLRDHVIFYLSSVPPANGTEYFRETFVAVVEEFHEPLLLLYQVGDDPDVTGVLNDMQVAYTWNGGKSEFDIIRDNTNIYRIPRYYYHFEYNTKEIPKYSYPQKDPVSNESIITMSNPIFFGDKFVGVAAIDVAAYDILSSLLTFRMNKYDYVFMVSIKDFLVMYHPLAPLPNAILGKASPIYLSMMIYKMPYWVYGDFLATGRVARVYNFDFARVFSKGHAYTDGVYEVVNTGILYCFPQSFFSWYNQICYLPVKTNPPVYSKTSLTKQLPKKDIKFTYHKYHMSGNETGTACRSFYRRTYATTTSLKFAPQSFKDPSWYAYHTETKRDIDHYENIFKGDAFDNRFAERMLDEVRITSILEHEWLDGSFKFGAVTHIVWRYFGSSSGLLRTHPTMLAPTALDPTRRQWFVKAEANPGTRVITTPYRDAYGAGYVVSIATAIFQKNTELYGVIGIDITLHYMQFLVETNFYQDCAQAGNVCFLMDSSGYIIVHPDWVNTTVTGEIKVERVHVIEKEPHIAYHMILNGLLKRDRCTDVYQSKDRTYYRVDIEGTRASHETNDTKYYRMVHADDSNFYVIQKMADPEDSNATEACLCNYWDNLCQLSTDECECPCTEDAPYEVCKLDIFIHWEADYKPCTPPLADPYDEANIFLGGEFYYDYEGLDFCIPRDCSKQLNLGECNSVAHCRWCTHDINGQPLKTSYCGLYDECWFGQVGRGTLYPDAVRVKEKKDILMIIGVSVAGVILGILLLGLMAYKLHVYLEWQKLLKEEVMTEEEDRVARAEYVRKRRHAIGDIRRMSDEMSEEEEAAMQAEAAAFLAKRRGKASRSGLEGVDVSTFGGGRRTTVGGGRKSMTFQDDRFRRMSALGEGRNIGDMDEEDVDDGGDVRDDILKFQAMNLVRLSLVAAAQPTDSSKTDDEEEAREEKAEEEKVEEEKVEEEKVEEEKKGEQGSTKSS